MVYKDYPLSESAVEVISADVQEYLRVLNMDTRSIQRIRLTTEELLLNILGAGGRNIVIRTGMGKQFGRHILRLTYEMDPLNPTTNSDAPWSEELLRMLGVFPSWSCRGKRNTVSLVLQGREKRSTVFYLALAIVSAVVLGIAGSAFPEALRSNLDEAILTPLSEGFLGLLNTFSGLMIAFTICGGILGMGNSETLGRTGKSVLLRFFGITFAVSAAVIAAILPLLKLNYAAEISGQASQLTEISHLFFDILPSDIIEPFKTGNALQIIVIAIFAGVSLLAIGERGAHIRTLMEEGTVLTQHIVSSVCSLIPLFVFATLLKQFWSGQTRMLLSIFKPTLLIIGVMLLLAAIMWLISSFRLRCPPMTLMKKVLPTFLLAFTTSSGVSAMPSAMETCENKLGANQRLVSFIYPLASVIYMPETIVYLAVTVCTFAEIYQIGIDLAWVAMAVIGAALIAIALPPIPNSTILGFTILFSMLGIPSQGLMMVTAIDVLVDFFDTGFNVMLMIFHTACEANRLGSLNRSILLNKHQIP